MPLQAFGYSVPELRVPMKPEVAVPIGACKPAGERRRGMAKR